MVHACSGVSPEPVEVHTQNYRIPVFQLSPLQDFPIPPNLCSLAPRKLFFLVLLARKLDFSQSFSYSCSPLLCSSTSGAHLGAKPWDKGGKWRTSLYDFSKFWLSFTICLLLFTLRSSSVLAFCFYIFGCHQQKRWAWVVLFHFC